ncbi:uncharacterized protein BJ171DRAFT_497468 [Polychytrium aggregatum]|uniref:uncharacterized protein n=1 Tax=Polychytrium aggregatum TaxID=110093 RepID=UPI0022FE864D|nr:uncharacterized protein BJ171DRAFT_497468 [Polychytrium aggregatum]KAI9206371.1 hypothetical protein BJ171DRAFT_497468 [Polychytrium aggregatum]
MRLIQAETGVILPAKSFTSLDSLDDVRLEIQALTSIPSNAQILLTSSCVQMKPEMMRQLESQSDKDEFLIYVFNRQFLDPRASGSFPRIAEQLEVEPLVSLDVIQASTRRATDPLLDATQSFVDVFSSHVKYGLAVWQAAVNHSSMCERLLIEQRNQADALRIATTNLLGHSRSVSEAFDLFYTQAQKELAKHSNLLQSFPKDLQALHLIPIHNACIVREPAVPMTPPASKNQFLSDYVPEDRLRAWADSCREAHEQLAKKCVQLLETVKSIKEGSEIERQQNLDVDFSKLESLVQSVQDHLRRLNIRQEVLEQDLHRVQSIIEDSRRPSIYSESDMSTALQHLLDIHHKEYTPEIAEVDRYIRETTIYFVEMKKYLTSQILSRLQSISRLQSSIASVNPILNSAGVALTANSQAFQQLLHVHRMPPAWGATMVEIVRRKEYARVFVAKCKDISDIFVKFTTQESKRRENFRNEIVCYLPNGLIQGLDDAPPAAEIAVHSTDDHLPNITKEDIREFEKLVAGIRISVGPGEGLLSSGTVIGGLGSVASSAATTIGGLGPGDSISKLRATMVKMTNQIDGIAGEFERVVWKSGLCERGRMIEEENARLKSDLASMRSTANPLISRRPSDSRSFLGAAQTSAANLGDHDGQRKIQDEKIKVYEARIRELEFILQQRYSKSRPDKFEEQMQTMQRQVETLRDTNAALEHRVREQQQLVEDLSVELEEHKKISRQAENTHEEWIDSLEKELADSRKQLDLANFKLEERARESAQSEAMISSLKKDLYRSRSFLHEIHLHLIACSRAFHPNPNAEESPIISSVENQLALVRSPTEGTIVPIINFEEVRRRLRELEDDIRCMALQMQTGVKLDESADPYLDEDERDDSQSQSQVASSALFDKKTNLSESGVSKTTQDTAGTHPWQERIQKLTEELSNVTNEHSRALERKQNEVNDLSRDCEAHKTRAQELGEQLSQSLEQYQLLKVQNEELLSKTEDLETRLAEAIAKSDRQRQKLEAELAKQRELLVLHETEHAGALTVLQHTIDTLEAGQTADAATIQGHAQHIAAQANDIVSLTSALREAEAELSELRDCYAAAGNELAVVQLELQQRSTAAAESQSALARMHQLLQQAEEQLKELRSQSDIEGIKYAELSDEASLLRDRLQQLEISKNEASTANDHLTQANRQLSEHSEQLQLKLQKLDESLRGAKGESAQLKERTEELQSQLTACHDRAAASEETAVGIADFRVQLAEALQRQAQLEATEKQLGAALQLRLSELAQAQKERDALEDELAQAREQISAAQLQKQGLEQQLADMESESAALSTKLEHAESSTAAHATQVQQHKQTIDGVAQQLSTLQNQTSVLEKELAESQTREQSLLLALETLRQEIQAAGAAREEQALSLQDLTARVQRWKTIAEDWATICRSASEALESRDQAIMALLKSCILEKPSPESGIDPSETAYWRQVVDSSELEELEDLSASWVVDDSSSNSCEISVGDLEDGSELIKALPKKVKIQEVGSWVVRIADRFDLNRLVTLFETYDRHLMGKRTADPESRPAVRETSQRQQKISFQNFQVNDLVLFLPTRNPKAWAAFNIKSPNYFLYFQNEDDFVGEIRNRDFILAWIINIQKRTASGKAGEHSNPFGLGSGTPFHLCQVVRWHEQQQQQRR